MGQLPWGMDTVSLVHVTATVGPESRGNGGFTQKGRFQVKRAGCPWGLPLAPRAVVLCRVCCPLPLLLCSETSSD